VAGAAPVAGGCTSVPGGGGVDDDGAVDSALLDAFADPHEASSNMMATVLLMAH
jgi:hypothetical protein